MGNKNKNHNKKWLISRLKTSGSKRSHIIDYGDYADTRNSKSKDALEDLPKNQGMGRSSRFNNGKINYGLLIRFLRGKVGQDWKEIHQEILERIPTNLLEYSEVVEWFVADLVVIKDNRLWNKRNSKYLYSGTTQECDWDTERPMEFYVDPDTNILMKSEGFVFHKKTKGMNTEELRLYRENEKNTKLAIRNCQKYEEEESKLEAVELLKIKKNINYS